MIENVHQQNATLISVPWGQCVQQIGNHAYGYLIDGFALIMLSEASEVNGVQSERTLASSRGGKISASYLSIKPANEPDGLPMTERTRSAPCIKARLSCFAASIALIRSVPN